MKEKTCTWWLPLAVSGSFVLKKRRRRGRRGKRGALKHIQSMYPHLIFFFGKSRRSTSMHMQSSSFLDKVEKKKEINMEWMRNEGNDMDLSFSPTHSITDNKWSIKEWKSIKNKNQVIRDLQSKMVMVPTPPGYSFVLLSIVSCFPCFIWNPSLFSLKVKRLSPFSLVYLFHALHPLLVVWLFYYSPACLLLNAGRLYYTF